MRWLKTDDVLIANPDLLDKKMKLLQESGMDQLCVIADWDRTMTSARTESGEDTTSYLAIVHSGYLGDVYRREMDRLYARYRPIEVSQTVSVHERVAAMHDWWAAAFALMQQHELTQDMIDEIARRQLMRLRIDAEQFLNGLVNRDVPLRVLSAGIDNVISTFLDVRDLLTANVQIVANQLTFDARGVVNGFCEPVVHSFNKQVDDAFVAGRRNVLLLGDTLEDAQMVTDEQTDCVIRVGFLNDAVEKFQEAYLSRYDVVICRDGPMYAVNELLDKVAGK